MICKYHEQLAAGTYRVAKLFIDRRAKLMQIVLKYQNGRWVKFRREENVWGTQTDEFGFG